MGQKMMRIRVLFILLSTIVTKATLAQGSPSYADHVRSFIHWYRGQFIKDQATVLQDSAEIYMYDTTFKDFLADTIDLTPADRAELRSYVHSRPISIWTAGLAGSARLLTTDSVRTLFGQRKVDPWAYLYQHYGSGRLFTFGAPIFLHQYTLCLFYAGYSCGHLCGEGGLCLYKRVGEEWVCVRQFSSWIS